MANELVLMERGFDRMNVPLNKVTEFLADGWKEISRKSVDYPQPERLPATAASKGKPKGKPIN